jgi:DNA-binding response OmpR family regulator
LSFSDVFSGAAPVKILLVEDEQEMARIISSLLKASGFVIDHVGTMREAEAATSNFAYDLNLIDRRLPDGDGGDLISFIRERRPGARVMMLTALDSLSHKVAALDAGADDYLTKPVQTEELMARIRACLRRPGAKEIPAINLGALCFDPETRTLTVKGAPVTLRRRELLLLESLISRANRVTPRETLMQEVFSVDDEIQGNVIDTLVSRLRQRLQALEADVVILTARGIGYMLTAASQ